MKVHVKKNDQIVVISGPDTIKGKQGKVLSVTPQTNKVIVEGVAFVSKHQKSRRQGQPGGIYQKERAVDASNVMLICPKCGQATRIAHKRTETETDKGRTKMTRVRVCKRCGAEIE